MAPAIPRSIVLAVVTGLVVPVASIAGCDRLPLLAPTGTVITLIPSTTNASLNSEVTIVATAIETGTYSDGSGSGTTSSTTTGAGTPVQNGTLISFTTTVGRLEPSEARTHNGQVTVRLILGGTSGTATVTAYSGGASAQITNLKVGTAAAATVSVTTTPQALGASGGSVQVVASVVDEGGGPVGGVPVTFSTDKGSISPSTVATDTLGTATATLTTTTTAKVTATVGALNGSSTVTVNARSLSSFTASPSAASAGVPITFTVTPTTGANISSVRISFGDGKNDDLGAIAGATTVPHSYSSPGTYTSTATAIDTSGDSGSLSTTVIIGSLPITVAASSTTPLVNSPVTFTVSGVESAQISHYTWTFDDGTGPFTTSSPQLSHSFTTRGAKTVRVDVFGVDGGQLGSASTSVDVQ